MLKEKAKFSGGIDLKKNNSNSNSNSNIKPDIKKVLEYNYFEGLQIGIKKMTKFEEEKRLNTEKLIKIINKFPICN